MTNDELNEGMLFMLETIIKEQRTQRQHEAFKP